MPRTTSAQVVSDSREQLLNLLKAKMLAMDEPFSSNLNLDQKKEKLKELMSNAIDGFMDEFHGKTPEKRPMVEDPPTNKEEVSIM